MAVVTDSRFLVRNLGLIEYGDALRIQRDLHEKILSGTAQSTLLLLEHPSVYTAGRRTQDHERPINGVPVIDVDRGGKITWHGPGQLVGYPIVKLKEPTKVVDFVRTLERALIATLKRFGIQGYQICDHSGVWLNDSRGERKIAAIGIRVAKGIVTHGFALNVNPDLSYFEQIIPCGIPDVITTSMSAELGRDVSIGEVLPILSEELAIEFERVLA
ncbi:MAG: lipoyl(octanoyl) transferase LipB [Actinobacteria bacterium]|nr:lipoyl(octanoyl) transferase LipB [Actinomycetota bacterium]